MKKPERIVEKIRNELLSELNQEVETRFGGNKAKAAETIDMHRIQFTNVCNGRVGTTIDKLIEIGTMFGWKIEFRVERRKEHGP